jgi:ABC-type antimicrobial peptide transport system permease subunit
MADVTESTGDVSHFARVPVPVLQYGRSQMSGLEEIAGIIPYNAKISIPTDDGPDLEFAGTTNGSPYVTTAITDPVYFDIFKYKWLAGNASTALKGPLKVVLSESRAKEYFGGGSPEKVLGKQIRYQDSLFATVSGIVKDPEKNTDLNFTDFISSETLGTGYVKNQINTSSWGQGEMVAWVFMKLAKNTSPTQINGELDALVKTHADSRNGLRLWADPLSNMHFNADIIENPIRTAYMPTLYALMGIAMFILLLAIINFINLSTAQSIQRTKEVGIRKILGGKRHSLALQFLIETLLLTLFSICIAVLAVNPILNGFREFIPINVSFGILEPSTLLFLLVVLFGTTFLAGFYPAKVLSSNMPLLNLKRSGEPKGARNWFLRKGLVVFQFTISLIFIVGSLVMFNQLRYMREKDLGFKADAIITVETPRGGGYSKASVYAERIRRIPGIDKVAMQWLSPMTDNARAMKLKKKASDEHDFWVAQVDGDENYIPLYEIKMVAGRNLTASDSVNEFVINESLSKLLGSASPEESLGKTVYWNDKPYPVVGVVADFHTGSLHEVMSPLCIINRPDRESALAIKLASKGMVNARFETTVARIGQEWEQLYPDSTFEYRFYDDYLAQLYEKDRRTAILINTATSMAIFISCMGLFGLGMFMAERRKKEIAVRKVLGASVGNIAAMLNKEFARLVLISLVLAAPIAWYFMNIWLGNFAYRVAINWPAVFLIAGLAVLVISILTVSYQALSAAWANPVNSLHAE